MNIHQIYIMTGIVDIINDNLQESFIILEVKSFRIKDSFQVVAPH